MPPPPPLFSPKWGTYDSSICFHFSDFNSKQLLHARLLSESVEHFFRGFEFGSVILFIFWPTYSFLITVRALT